jgi:hypothetical protein
MLDRHPHLGQPAPDPVAAQPATREVRDRREINHPRTIAHQIHRLEFIEFQRSFRWAGSAARNTVFPGRSDDLAGVHFRRQRL